MGSRSCVPPENVQITDVEGGVRGFDPARGLKFIHKSQFVKFIVERWLQALSGLINASTSSPAPAR